MVVQLCQWHSYQYQRVSSQILSKWFSLLTISLHPARRKHRKTFAFQSFSRQMYHACLAQLFEPLKAGMTIPEVIKCSDGHWRQAIYGLGPYIADYPEQVWLAAVVQGWCPKSVSFRVSQLPFSLGWPMISLDAMQIPKTLMQMEQILVGKARQTFWSTLGILEFCGLILVFVRMYWYVFFFVSTTHCPHIHPLEAIHSRLPPGWYTRITIPWPITSSHQRDF